MRVDSLLFLALSLLALLSRGQIPLGDIGDGEEDIDEGGEDITYDLRDQSELAKSANSQKSDGSSSSSSSSSRSSSSSGEFDIVALTDKTFEHLTQASSGSTTGDWLIKFYAPWCKHCKALAPLMERAAVELQGSSVNVAKIDCEANKVTPMRFGIRGFPTVLLLSKGKTYIFKEDRTVESLVEFARGGFKLHEGDKTPSPLSNLFAELQMVLRHAYKEAQRDLKARRYVTYNTVLMFAPTVFGIIILLLICIPVRQPRLSPTAMRKRFPANPPTPEPTAGRALPPTSASDSSTPSQGLKED